MDISSFGLSRDKIPILSRDLSPLQPRHPLVVPAAMFQHPERCSPSSSFGQPRGDPGGAVVDSAAYSAVAPASDLNSGFAIHRAIVSRDGWAFAKRTVVLDVTDTLAAAHSSQWSHDEWRTQ